MIKKVIILTFILTLFVCASTVCHAAVDYSGIIESESDWIASLQQPTGSLVITRDHTWTDYSGEPGVPHYKIEPYFVNLGVIGMLENPATDNIAVAGNWMAWYLNHLNNPDYSGLYGSVYMYWADTSGSTEHSSGTYDSTDSYGATFMTLLRKYYETSGDSTFFTSNRINIEKVADSIVATQQTDGLTYAMPSYQVKYAMDNAEVHEGLTDIEWIERNIYSDSAKADYYKGKKVSNFNGIESYLWDDSANNYRKYDGATSNWATFYPDATCQMFPVSCGVIGPRSLRADYLYMQLNTNHYEWPYLNTSEAEGFPWAVLAYGAAEMGDKDRVDIFLDKIKTTFIDAGRPYPYYCTEAGMAIRAARTIRDMYNLALNKTATASSNSSTAANTDDGNLASAWTGAAADNEWILYDLGASRQLNRVLLKWGADYADQYRIQVSDDGSNFTDAYVESAGNGGTDDILLSSIQTKRYVKLLFTHRSSLNGVSIKETEIYYEAPDLAENKTVTASSNTADAYKSADGETDTRWGSTYSDNQWYKIDLGSATTVNKVVIDWEYAYDTVYSVQVSTDDSDYTTVYSTSAGDGGIDTITFTPASARYVKILCTTRATPYGSSFWETRVYNDTTNPTSPVNYALNKTATASSVQPDSTFTADKAVDGSLSTRWSSEYSDNQWWKVDLGSVVNNVRRVVIRWEAAYDTGYSIQVSTDNVNFTTVYSTTSGGGGIDEIQFEPASARYVKILCTSRATPYGSSFWEFEVYDK